MGQRLPPGFLPPAGLARVVLEPSVLWRCLGDSMEPGSQRKSRTARQAPLPTTKPARGPHQPAHPAFRAPEAGRGQERGPTQERRLARRLGRAPRPHKRQAPLRGLCRCPHGPHSLDTPPGARTGPLLTPEPWEGAQGLDLGGARCTPSSARTARVTWSRSVAPSQGPGSRQGLPAHSSTGPSGKPRTVVPPGRSQ